MGRVSGRRIRELYRQISQLQAEFVRCIGEFDAAREYEVDEYRSSQSWLRHELRLHPREAAQLVDMARQLPHLPAVGAAFAAGEISHAHAAVLARTARQIGVEHVAASERALLDVALAGGPERLRLAAQHVRYCVDPDAADRDAVRAYERRELSVTPTVWGMVAIQGMLDPGSGATVLAALDALTSPPRGGDARTAGQRRADALTELCRRALDGGTLPQVNGEKPHLLVTVSYETLTDQLAQSYGGAARATTSTPRARSGTGRAHGDPPRSGWTGEPPGEAARAPCAGRMQDGQSARLSWVGPISGGEARMLACDCAVIPAVLNGAGEVLDIGRKSRIWPTAIRRAIELRDGTCRHVNCDVPSQHCDIHHRRHWADGGSTSYDNGVLICRHHHTQIHKYGVRHLSNGQFAVMRN